MADDSKSHRIDTTPDGPGPSDEYTPAWSFGAIEEPTDEEVPIVQTETAELAMTPVIGHESNTLVQERVTVQHQFDSSHGSTDSQHIEKQVVGIAESAPQPVITVQPAKKPGRKPWVDRFADKPVMIEFENVTKSFRNQLVLRDLSFQVRQGETVCLIGESGCGKTVNLKLMIGLMKADKGTVKFKGDNLARMNEKQITATRIKFGFLFQMAALFDSMSIYDNVAFGLREHRLMPESEMPAYIQERLTEVGLPAGVESKKPAELSGGQRKRVGLARALALRPEVMLYDEPTTGLDPIMTDIINELILQTQNHGERAGIIVTHEMRTVTKCADRVIMLYPITRLGQNESQILYNGPPDGMEDHPDPRVRQFVRGEAGDRIREMSLARLSDETDSILAPMEPDEIVAARPPRDVK